MNEIEIIKNLRFNYIETQLCGDGCGEHSNTHVDKYVNETHRIFHWKSTNKFSIKNLKTTSTTMILEFKYVMNTYFNDICS